MDSWESWIQNVGGGLIKTATEAKFNQPYELQKMRLQAYGPYGDAYQEGVPNPIQGAIPGSWLLIGGALLVAAVLLKD